MEGTQWTYALTLLSIFWATRTTHAAPAPPTSQERVAEWNIETSKYYADPFNDVDLDVVFTSISRSWRVPTFWIGGSKWSVRFAPPSPGVYQYHLESSDKNNPDLNGHRGKIDIRAYTGPNPLLQHGALKVSANGRYFEHLDGTPFYWLGDTWWTGLSDRLSWDEFQELTADRKGKGFTVVQMTTGLAPTPEEVPPTDPGCTNEGGSVWDATFTRINPQFFDYADRRVQHLLDAGLVPALVGAWRGTLAKMGIAKMEKHWRYIIARYGAYPVFWIAGGEVFDPPESVAERLENTPLFSALRSPGWTEIARYIRNTDPYHHPLAVHEIDPPYNTPLQDPTLADFYLFQAGHRSWPSIATAVSLLDTHYAQTDVTKPMVVGEIGYENLAATHLEDFQRSAFWLSMLNGAAGHTYGAIATWMSYTPEKLHRIQLSFLNWQEGMNLPGSNQVGLGAKLLRKYPWWNFQPHPEWVMPRGTTLLEPHPAASPPPIDLIAALSLPTPPPDEKLPLGAWSEHNGNFRQPYAAGIPRKVRIIYMPYFGFVVRPPPTVLGLESGVTYHAYYWDPSLGIQFDLGHVKRPSLGKKVEWTLSGDGSAHTVKFSAKGNFVSTTKRHSAADLAAGVTINSKANGAILLRYHDPEDYLAAIYSSKRKMIYLLERHSGKDGELLGPTPVQAMGAQIRLDAEIRGNAAVMSLTDGMHSNTTPIVMVKDTTAGEAGVAHLDDDGDGQEFDHFELRESSKPMSEGPRSTRLYDGNGNFRADLSRPGSAGLSDFGFSDSSNFNKERHLLLDAYQPEQLPYFHDWLLVLEAEMDPKPDHDGSGAF